MPESEWPDFGTGDPMFSLYEGESVALITGA